MTRSVLTRLVPVLGAAGALALAGTTAAHAAVNSWGPGSLASGTEVCISATATGDARATGSADAPGVRFRVFRDGVELTDPNGVRRNSFDKYYLGAGSYRFCAKNALGLGGPVTNVSLVLRTDPDA